MNTPWSGLADLAAMRHRDLRAEASAWRVRRELIRARRIRKRGRRKPVETPILVAPRPNPDLA